MAMDAFSMKRREQILFSPVSARRYFPKGLVNSVADDQSGPLSPVLVRGHPLEGDKKIVQASGAGKARALRHLFQVRAHLQLIFGIGDGQILQEFFG